MTTKTADGLREAIDEAVVESEFPSDLSEGTYTIVDTSKVARAIVEYLELTDEKLELLQFAVGPLTQMSERGEYWSDEEGSVESVVQPNTVLEALSDVTAIVSLLLEASK